MSSCTSCTFLPARLDRTRPALPSDQLWGESEGSGRCFLPGVTVRGHGSLYPWPISSLWNISLALLGGVCGRPRSAPVVHGVLVGV